MKQREAQADWMENRPLSVLAGPTAGTFTVGRRIGGVPHRDPRFAASMSYREAEWSVNNQRELPPGFHNLSKGK